MIKFSKIMLIPLLGLLATSSYALSRETNVCFENQSKETVVMIVPKVDGYSAPNTWNGSAHQAQEFTTIIYPKQIFCKRLELAHTTDLVYKKNADGSLARQYAFFKVSLNKGPLIYIEGFPSDHSYWAINFTKSPGYDDSLIGEFYKDEAPYTKLGGQTFQKSVGLPCNSGNACSKFIITPEFNRPYQQ